MTVQDVKQQGIAPFLHFSPHYFTSAMPPMSACARQGCINKIYMQCAKAVFFLSGVRFANESQDLAHCE